MLKKYAGEVCAFVVFQVLFWGLVLIAQFVKLPGALDLFAQFVWYLSFGIFLAIPISQVLLNLRFSRFVIFKVCSCISLVVAIPFVLFLASIPEIGLLFYLTLPCSGLVISTIGQWVRLYTGRKNRKG